MSIILLSALRTARNAGMQARRTMSYSSEKRGLLTWNFGRYGYDCYQMILNPLRLRVIIGTPYDAISERLQEKT